jgi:hypothetical protein
MKSAGKELAAVSPSPDPILRRWRRVNFMAVIRDPIGVMSSRRNECQAWSYETWRREREVFISDPTCNIFTHSST